MHKGYLSHIPRLPVSALLFYSSMVVLRKLGILPGPTQVLAFLEGLYDSYGLTGLFLASFLEGIVYVGLYFPGSFIVALAIILSDGTFHSLLAISLIVAGALTLTSFLNYLLGKKILAQTGGHLPEDEKTHVFSKALFASLIHPNALAFYFFDAGTKHHNFRKIGLVPLVMIPYGLGMGYLIYALKDPLKSAIENPAFMIGVICIWLLIAIIRAKKKKRTPIAV